MDPLSAWIRVGIEWTGLTILHGTVLSLLTWLITATVLRRARPAVHAAIWTVVLLKFLVPPAAPWIPGLSEGLSVAVGWLAKPAAAAATVMPGGVSAGAGTASPFAAEAREVSGLPVHLGASLLVVYFAGLAWVVRRAWRSGARMRRWLAELPPAGPGLEREVRELAAAMGLRRRIRIRVTERDVSPFVVGVVRPCMVVPLNLLDAVPPAMRSALLLHELAHFRRGDTVLRWVQQSAGLLLYFWPPVRWTCRKIERAAELACDQWAVAVSRVDPETYAESLLKIARRLGNARTPGYPLAFVKSTSILEERFAMLLQGKKRMSPGLSVFSLLLLGSWGVFALAGSGVETGPGPQEKGTAERRIVLHVKGPVEEVRIPADVLKEADLDGDGFLSVPELEDWAREHPEDLVLQVEPGSEGVREIRIHSGGAGEAPVWHEAVPPGSGEKKVFFLRGPWNEEIAGRMLEHHPDADTDGDGVLTEAEFREYMKVQSAASGDFLFLRGEAPVEIDEEVVVDEAGNRKVIRRVEVIHAAPDGVHVIEGGEPTKDKHFMFIRRAPGEAPAAAPTSPEQRRQEFLKSHPEADLDGDGVISQQEAEALAAKLRREAAPKAKDQ